MNEVYTILLLRKERNSRLWLTPDTCIASFKINTFLCHSFFSHSRIQYQWTPGEKDEEGASCRNVECAVMEIWDIFWLMCERMEGVIETEWTSEKKAESQILNYKNGVEVFSVHFLLEKLWRMAAFSAKSSHFIAYNQVRKLLAKKIAATCATQSRSDSCSLVIVRQSRYVLYINGH